jgi:hypothetical protein
MFNLSEVEIRRPPIPPPLLHLIIELPGTGVELNRGELSSKLSAVVKPDSRIR